MSKKFEIGIAIFAIAVALIALIFGDNIYQQITGQSAYKRSLTPTPRVECPSGITCYSDYFSELSPNRWGCDDIPEGVEVKNNRLIISAPAGITRELHPCPYLEVNIAFVEIEVNILQSDGVAGNAHAGIGASLNESGFVYVQVNSAGKTVLTYSSDGKKSEGGEKISLNQSTSPHILRIEWSGEKVIFLVDNLPFSTQIDSKLYGRWFLITVNAWENANITAEINGIRWGVVSP
ncbi:MAG: hypothetical protein Fur0022_36220 [Anaerolineales bacterium]